MDNLIDTIAAWPWVTYWIIWFAGWLLHIPIFVKYYEPPYWLGQAWLFFWPIVTPLYLAAYPIRRVVRWWRARRNWGKWVPTKIPMHGVVRCLKIPESEMQEPVWTPTPAQKELYDAVMRHRGALGRVGPVINSTLEERNYDGTEKPRPPEKSAPYVLDTSRAIRELRERVAKQDEKMLALENNGNDALYAMSQRVAKLEATKRPVFVDPMAEWERQHDLIKAQQAWALAMLDAQNREPPKSP